MEPILNIVLPVFAIIAVGYGCGRLGLLGAESSAALNGFVYWVALPIMLFRAMALVDMRTLLAPGFLAAVVGGQVLLWAAAIPIARLAFRNTPAEAGLHGMNAIYGNTGYMGIPLAITAFGQEAALPAIVATVVNAALVVTIATALVEFGQSRGGGLPRVLKDVGFGLLTNPLLVAPVLGILWSLTGLKLPVPLDTFTGILGAAAGPCALFAIGLFLVGRPFSHGLIEVSWMTFLKLVIHPALTAVLAFYAFTMDPLWALMAVLMAAMPTGAGSFVLAQAYGLYVQRTSSVILISTVLSVVTLSAFFILFPPGR